MHVDVNDPKIRKAIADTIIENADAYKRADASLFMQVLPQVQAALNAIDWPAMLNAVAIAIATTATKVALENALKDKKENDNGKR